MSSQDKTRTIIVILLAGVTTWILFFIAFILLTKSIMMYTESDVLAIILIIISLLVFLGNFFISKVFMRFIPQETLTSGQVRTQHEIITSLDRISHVILLLISLGIISALSTFIYLSMIFMETNNLMYLIQPLPVLFVIYLLFALPSFYAMVEITRLKHYLANYSKIKEEIKSKMIKN